MSDVCIVGGGAAGCVLALRLARRGLRVEVLESGPRWSEAEKERLFLDRAAGRVRGNPYRLDEPAIEAYRNAGEVALPLDMERVRALGGTSLFWLGNTPRMLAADFRMRSRFGVGEDWPIGYDELEPWYGQAEQEIGVAGADDNPLAEPRSTPYPMPPIPMSYADRVLKRTTDALGIEFHHTPQARNSLPYDRRSQCLSCALCDVCPSGAKATFDRTHAAPAERTGRVRFVTEATVLRLELDTAGRVARAVWAGRDRVERASEAPVFVVASGGIETPRLLLLSAERRFPDGLANRSGALGRFLINHPIVQRAGRVDQPLYPYRVGFESTESFHYYATDTRDETAGFLMNMNNSSGTGGHPHHIAAGLPLWGDALRDAVREQFGRWFSLSAGVDQLPDPANAVELDPELRDPFGSPVPRVSYRWDAYTRDGLARAAAAQAEILEAAGAREVGEPAYWWPGHHMGTLRMGERPEQSVVDRDLRCHDVPNLYLCSTGCFVTGGCANPTLTLSALALRLGDHLARRARA